MGRGELLLVVLELGPDFCLAALDERDLRVQRGDQVREVADLPRQALLVALLLAEL